MSVAPVVRCQPMAVLRRAAMTAGAVAGSGLMQIFTERHIADVMEAVFDVPVSADPGLQITGQGRAGGQ